LDFTWEPDTHRVESTYGYSFSFYRLGLWTIGLHQMAWNLARYYTRSKKINGRIYRQYIGGGETGRLAAQHDQERRERIKMRREATKCLMSDLKAIDETVTMLCCRADLAARAAMWAAGYYQHHRGEWRRRGVQ
jgi:hypothetical protein